MKVSKLVRIYQNVITISIVEPKLQFLSGKLVIVSPRATPSPYHTSSFTQTLT